MDHHHRHCCCYKYVCMHTHTDIHSPINSSVVNTHNSVDVRRTYTINDREIDCFLFKSKNNTESIKKRCIQNKNK